MLQNCQPTKYVAVVDDDEALLSSLKFMLEIEGFAVCTFRTAEDLLARIEPARTRCVIVDYYLKGLNGMELIQRLRMAGVDTPAILITTQPSSYLRGEAERAGLPIVEKPLLGDGLSDRIKAL